MKTIVTSCLLFICCGVFAQKANHFITIGFTDSLYSNVLHEKRMIRVHIPNNDTSKHYPVLFILDGEDYFNSAVAMTEQLSGPLPELIVIGIDNTDRQRDMTPSKIQADRLVNAGNAARSGGGDAFATFIATELIPYVNKQYPTTPYRVISGHSLAGLEVVNHFFNHTNVFSAYIAIDPSLWWNDRKWIAAQQEKLQRLDLTGKSLFVAIANNLPKGMDTISVLKDTTDNTVLTRSVLGFVHALKTVAPKGLAWSYRYYPEEWHGIVEFHAEYDALRYLFNWYRFDMNILRADPSLNPDSLIEVHYKKVSAKLGYTVLPGESNINDLGYFYMGNNQYPKAYALLKRNTINYPNSANAFDSLGDYYVAVGDKKQAIEAFTQSLRLAEVEETRKKLNELLK